MKFKQFFQSIVEKISKAWHEGVIQKTSRITYDIVWNIILFLIILGGLFFVFAGAVGAGYFASLVKDEPIHSYKKMQQDIYNYEETSELYFANNKYIGEVQAELKREEIALDNISESLIQAVIATEDQLFYEHDGVVPKAIIRAIFQEATNSETKSGGSTLTQQLIKNQLLTNEVSFERKAKEIVLALRLERFFEKDEILEAYLNVIPYGRDASGSNIAGIHTAAKGVFGIGADELNLPQAAYLAGIPQNPYVFTPFLQDRLKDEEGLQPGINRMKTVLKRMLEVEFISQEQYNEAIAYDITEDFTTKAVSPREEYPVLVFELEKEAKKVLTKTLAKQDGYTDEDLEVSEDLQEQYAILADRALRMNGYKIHSTIDKDMYETMRKVGNEYPYYGPDHTERQKNPETGEKEAVTQPIQGAAVLIENKTGKLLSFYGGREATIDRHYNFAITAKRQPGSTIKPLAVYAPAMELGMIQPGSVVADVPGLPGYSPKNYGGAYYGLVSARQALTSSYNVSTVEIYKKILSQDPETYLEKMGIQHILYDDASLALGTNDMSVLENVNAFATLSNQGKFTDAYMIEKITTKDGDVIYEHEVNSVDVFSPQTAYLTIDMMRDVVRQGTGAYIPSQLKHGGVDWAGKTGTSDDYKDAWFIGTNPNVTLGTWIGYENPTSIWCNNCPLSYSQRNQNLWARFANAMADIDKDLVAPQKRFEQPEGIVHRSYCATSGLIPSDLCQQAGLVRSDIYNAKYVPSKVDDSLIGAGKGGSLVVVDGNQVLAGPNTPEEFTTGYAKGIAFNPAFLQRMGYNRFSDLSVLYPRHGRENWVKIGLSAGSSNANVISNQGTTPTTPSSVSHSGQTLSWGQSSNYIVGYRIYHATQEGGSLKRIGHTTNTSYNISNESGYYYIKAVDYFGQESASSESIIVQGTNNQEQEEKLEQEEDDNDNGNDEDSNQDQSDNEDTDANDNGNDAEQINNDENDDDD